MFWEKVLAAAASIPTQSCRDAMTSSPELTCHSFFLFFDCADILGLPCGPWSLHDGAQSSLVEASRLSCPAACGNLSSWTRD